MIFNNRTPNQQINQSISKKGEMFNSADKQYIIMNLFDGVQFQETGGDQPSKQNYPFVRIQFKSWQKIFDLSEFDRQKTDEGLFKNHQKMKNSSQLLHFADSIRKDGNRYLGDMKTAIGNEFTPIRSKARRAGSPASAGASSVTVDTVATDLSVQAEKDKISLKMDSLSKTRLAGTPYEKQAITSVADTQSIKKLPKYFYDFQKDLKPYEKSTYYTTAQEKARNILNASDNAINQIEMVNDSAGKFIYEMNMKYNYAIICLVFLFIGAPMGAIIQKGGFGMPILVAIVFFMVYMVSIIYCKNLKESHDLGFIMAAWLPVFVMVPIAAILTYRALNDYKMLNFNPAKFFEKLNFPFFKKKLNN
jgi:lipopolysaccharide export system permease protein